MEQNLNKNTELNEQQKAIEQQIFMMDAQLAIMISTDMSKTSSAKFMIAMYDEMHKQGIGHLSKYIGRMGIKISDQFWQNEERAKRITTNLVLSYKKMYEMFKENFGDDAEQIFADNCYQTRFTA